MTADASDGPRDMGFRTPTPSIETEPRWVVVCNMTSDPRPGWPNGGTRVFAPGTKLYAGRLPGDPVAIQVIGLGRRSRRLAAAFQAINRLTNARPQLVYSPSLIASLGELGCRFFADRRQAQLGADFINHWRALVLGGTPEPVAVHLPAAERGDERSRFELGLMFEQGRPSHRPKSEVAVDLGEAARWYGLAAAQGFAPAAVMLARLCERGEGAPRNDAEALRLYRIAAEAGDLCAALELARRLPADAARPFYERLAADPVVRAFLDRLGTNKGE